MHKNKTVLFIIPSYMPDIRNSKFIKSFYEKGFNVYVLAYEFRDFKIYKHILDGVNNVKVYKIKSIFPTVNIPFNLFRDQKIKNYLNQIKPDIVLCRDIFLSTFLTKNFKKKNPKTKFILDICDNYPEVVENIYGGIKGKFLGIVLNIVEKRALKLFDYINFVSEYSFNYIIGKHKINGLNHTVILNVPLKPNLKFNSTNRNGMVYIGTIDKGIRDIDTILKAIKYLKENDEIYERLDIYYFQSDINLIEEYKSLSLKYGIEELINFYEAVERTKLDEILVKYKIGIVPHCRNKATDFTIPNKLFDYISNGLAVLASDNPAMMDIINKYDIGMVYEGGNYIDCAFKMKRLLSEYYDKKYFNKGPMIIQKELNWEYCFENFYNFLLRGEINY